MTDIEKIVKIIENNSPELAAEEILRLFNVVGPSEQLFCPVCSSDNIDADFNYYNFCLECKHDWEK